MHRQPARRLAQLVVGRTQAGQHANQLRTWCATPEHVALALELGHHLVDTALQLCQLAAPGEHGQLVGVGRRGFAQCVVGLAQAALLHANLRHQRVGHRTLARQGRLVERAVDRGFAAFDVATGQVHARQAHLQARDIGRRQLARQCALQLHDRLIVQAGMAIAFGSDQRRLDRAFGLIGGPPVASQLRRRKHAIEHPRDG